MAGTTKAQTAGPSDKAKHEPPQGGWAKAPELVSPLESPLNKFNINTVSADHLSKIPQMTGTRATLVTDQRTMKGPFHRLSEVKNIPGIGDTMAQAIIDRCYCGDPNEPSPREKEMDKIDGNINA